jgi:cytochrome bd-type quinol oxidase subunit 2
MKKLLLGLLVILSGLQLVAAPALVYATPKDEVCNGIALTGANCTQDAQGDVSNILKLVINLLSLLVGVAAVVMIIIGGFKYIISSGDSSNVNSAKNTIMFAVIGLVIVAMAQIIVIFVLNKTAEKPAGQTPTQQTP